MYLNRIHVHSMANKANNSLNCTRIIEMVTVLCKSTQASTSMRKLDGVWTLLRKNLNLHSNLQSDNSCL